MMGVMMKENRFSASKGTAQAPVKADCTSKGEKKEPLEQMRS